MAATVTLYPTERAALIGAEALRVTLAQNGFACSLERSGPAARITLARAKVTLDVEEVDGAVESIVVRSVFVDEQRVVEKLTELLSVHGWLPAEDVQ